MRFKYFLTVFLILPFITHSQERNDIGLMTGTSYYMGDFNPGTQFYRPAVNVGVMFRHNFNKFYSLRFSGSLGQINGSYNPNKFYLPNTPGSPTFSKRVVELNAAVEIGLRPFGTKPTEAKSISPYAVFGFGGAHIGTQFLLHFPIGAGVKYTPSNRWTLGAEWRVHKTFTDQLDDYSNISSTGTIRIHNYDWFSIAGIFVTFRLVKEGVVCPAYK